jgi:hydrogenase maturation factor HypF (carbamoyltransferase family)
VGDLLDLRFLVGGCCKLCHDGVSYKKKKIKITKKKKRRKRMSPLPSSAIVTYKGLGGPELDIRV